MVTVAGPRGPRPTVLPYYRTSLLTWHSGGAEHACACFCGYMRRGMWLTCAGACGGASRGRVAAHRFCFSFLEFMMNTIPLQILGS